MTAGLSPGLSFHITTNDTDLHFTNLQYTKMLLIFSNFSVSALIDSVKTGLN